MLLAPFCRFFVNLIKKSLTICLWSADQKRFVYSLRGLPIIMGSPLKMEVALWRKETFPYMTPFTQT